MRSAVVAFVIAFVAFLMFGGTIGRALCGARLISTSTREVGPMAPDSEEKTASPTVGAFHVVIANGSINVNITNGPTPSLTFQARADVLPHLTSEVKEGVLTIGINDSGIDDVGRITATIVTPNIDGVTLNGSGNVDVQGVKSADFSGMINGSGNLTAKGSADSASFTVDGSGDIDSKDLLATATKVNIAGSGNAEVNAAKKLEATIAGSGDVKYTGNPPDVHRNVFGSGSVESE